MTSATVKITVLVDNRADNDLRSEHGFSLWIETEGKHILFDTGQGECLIPNAQRLGIDLAKTDILVLSHGHYDHTGGIPQVLEQAREVKVYAHPAIFLPRYVVNEQERRSIAMPAGSKTALDKLDPRSLVWVQQPILLSDRIGLTGPIPRETCFEDCGGAFFLDPEGTKADLIEDDLSLWIRTDKGVILCTGCCHSGLINTLNYVKRIHETSRIRMVIGGLHLLNAGKERMDPTMETLKRFDLERLIPCHCTGEAAVALLQQALDERVLYGSAGTVFLF